MKNIKAISKIVFDDNFNNARIKNYEDYACFISILDEDNKEEKYDLSLNNFLQVRMWDIEEDILNYKKPSDSELSKIVNFVNKHKDKNTFVIHCSAGISRSGAVAMFLFNKFYSEIDKEQFKRENKNILPNLYVRDRLKILDRNE